MDKVRKAPQLPSRMLIEMTILKALVWKEDLRREIFTSFTPEDFSEETRSVYIVLSAMIKNGKEVTKETLDSNLDRPLTFPIFDNPPKDKDLAIAFELFKQKVQNKKKALEKIHGWKKTIDSLTILVEKGRMEPRQWVEQLQGLIPQPKIESNAPAASGEANAEESKKLAAKEAEIQQKEQKLLEKETEVNQKDKNLHNKETEVSQKEQKLLEKEMEVGNKEQKLAEKESVIYLREKKLAEREFALQSIERADKHKIQSIASKENALIGLEKELNLKLHHLEDRERKLFERDKFLKTQEEELKKLAQIEKQQDKEDYSLKKNKIWQNIYKRFKTQQWRGIDALDPGFPEFKNRFGGMRGTTVIYGPAKKGKTSLAIQMAFGALVNNDCSLMYYSSDAIPDTIFHRISSKLSGIPYSCFVKNELHKLSESDKSKLHMSMEKIQELQSCISVIGNNLIPHNVKQFKNQIKEFVEGSAKKQGLLVIDSLNSFSDYINTGGGNRAEEKMIQCLNILREVQVEFGLTVIATLGNNTKSNYLEDKSESSERNLIINMVDMFTDIIPRKHRAYNDESFSNRTTNIEEIDLIFTCRDADNLYLPMVLTRDCLNFVLRKKGFKARKIDWGKKSQQIEQPVKKQQYVEPPKENTAYIADGENSLEAEPEQNKPRSPLGETKQQLSVPRTNIHTQQKIQETQTEQYEEDYFSQEILEEAEFYVAESGIPSGSLDFESVEFPSGALDPAGNGMLTDSAEDDQGEDDEDDYEDDEDDGDDGDEDDEDDGDEDGDEGDEDDEDDGDEDDEESVEFPSGDLAGLQNDGDAFDDFELSSESLSNLPLEEKVPQKELRTNKAGGKKKNAKQKKQKNKEKYDNMNDTLAPEMDL